MIDSRHHLIALRTLARVALLALGVLVASAPAARAIGTALGVPADSVVKETWTLANGTHVIAQHIPLGFGVAISVGYPGGSDQDPDGSEGLAALLAELQFTAAAGDVPERSRREMSSVRPMGADVHVGKRVTVFTEVASRTQVYGVLHQVIARMRGVQITPEDLAAARASVRERAAQQFLGKPDLMLYNEVSARAAGADDAKLRRLGTLPGLEKLTVADVATRLAAAFPSRRAVIAIAGNLEGLDLEKALAHELASLPGGSPGPMPPARPMHAISAAAVRANLSRPVGALGIIAPALGDSSYPAFFVASIILGAQTGEEWGDPVAPLTSRFQFSVLEEPELLRFYPPLDLKDRTPAAVAESFAGTIGRQDNLVVQNDVLAELRYGIAWLIGGPVNSAALNHMRTDGGALILLATNMAERELSGGEAFWKKFRVDVERAGMPDLVYWLGYMGDPKLQARLVLLPPDRAAGGAR